MRIRRLCWLLALILVCALMPGLAEAPAAELEVYFMDLGRVDGILIRCGGEVCFIDVGFHSDAKLAIQWLQAMGIGHLDSYVGTHGHYDHIEGAPDLIEAFHPDVVYLSHIGCLSAMLECATEAQQAVLSATDRVILLPGDSFTVGAAKLTCVGPLEIVRCYTGDNDENDNSLILRLDYGERSILFTGDTTDNVLRQIEKKQPGSLKADIFKNPHHNGSHDGDVLDMVSPEYVVFCTDDDNPPRESYLELLSEKGIHALCLGASNQGSVGVISDGVRLEIRCGTAVDEVHLEQPSDMVPGQAQAVTGAVVPEGKVEVPRQLGWNSSDEGVVTVDNGVLRAVAPGTAVVSAVAINGASDSVEVRVMDACVVLEESTVHVAVGETRTLKNKIQPRSARSLETQWFAEDPNVAAVSDGAVTGVSEGTARVAVRLANGAVSYCKVVVTGHLVNDLKLGADSATMNVGDTLTLSVTVDPADYSPDELEWHSSDESVLWVDGYGNVTAVREGKARITVTAYGGVRDSCTIRVK